jgi:hypothetical protein
VYHSSFTPDVSDAIGAVASSLGLIPTGGSAYHGDLMTYADAHATLHVPASVAEGLRRALI